MIPDDYITAYEKHKTILEEHNNLMIRIVSVTNDVLRETLHSEYIIVAQKLANAEISMKQLEITYIKHIGNALLSEFMDFYGNQFVKESLEHVLSMQGFNLAEYIKKHRMRPITSLNQKRELTVLLNELRKQLKIIDYQGMVVDVIGKYMDTNPFICRCIGFANINSNCSVTLV